MSAVEEIQAAIEKLTELKADSTQGYWFWNPPSKDRWPQGDEGLDATHGQWKTCTYYCAFDESSVTSRGESGKPGHEHLEREPVLSGWGYDASGIDGSAADRELITVLHRTIDAQLAILRDAEFMLSKYGPVGTSQGVTLARAINGGVQS